MAPLSYNDWPKWPDGTVRKWKIKELPSAPDVGKDDELTVSFDTSGLMIKIDSFTCTAHTPTHDANSWLNRACSVMASNRVKGSRPSPLFDQFELVSSEVEEEGGNKHNKLTCRVLVEIPKFGGLLKKGDSDSDSFQRDAGSVCWTAEDG